MKRNQTNRPSHAVYVVEGEGDSAYWTKDPLTLIAVFTRAREGERRQ